MGPAVVGAAYVTVRGTLKTYTKNAITILEKSGRQRQVALAPRALVCSGLKPGDEVVLRIPFDEGADCRTADRVERPAAPKPAPKSKFSQAQSPGV
jgi:multidrug efflux pump subunit AcrA (membrane-fusion protein)